MYICPKCQQELDRSGRGYKCSRCSAFYCRYEIDGVELVDFIGVSSKKNCQCQIDGKTTCQVDFKNELSKLMTKPRKERKKIGKKAKIIENWCGKGNKIIDLGCREAPYGDLISKENKVYGLDNCPKAMLLRQREGINDNALNKGYRVLALADCLSLPFSNQEFDLVLATEIMEHIFETRQFIREIYRVLKKGGNLIISVPNLVSIYTRLSLLVGSGRSFVPWAFIAKGDVSKDAHSLCYPEQNIHIRFFTFASLKRFIKEEGFICLDTVGIDPLLSKIRLDKVFKTCCDEIMLLAKKV